MFHQSSHSHESFYWSEVLHSFFFYQHIYPIIHSFHPSTSWPIHHSYIHRPIYPLFNQYTYKPTNLSIHSCMGYSIHTLIHLGVFPFLRFLIHSTYCTSIHSFNPPTYPSINPSIHPPAHPPTHPLFHQYLLSIYPPTLPSSYPPIHSSNRLLTHLTMHFLFIMTYWYLSFRRLLKMTMAHSLRSLSVHIMVILVIFWIYPGLRYCNYRHHP